MACILGNLWTLEYSLGPYAKPIERYIFDSQDPCIPLPDASSDRWCPDPVKICHLADLLGKHEPSQQRFLRD